MRPPPRPPPNVLSFALAAPVKGLPFHGIWRLITAVHDRIPSVTPAKGRTGVISSIFYLRGLLYMLPLQASAPGSSRPMHRTYLGLFRYTTPLDSALALSNMFVQNISSTRSPQTPCNDQAMDCTPFPWHALYNIPPFSTGDVASRMKMVRNARHCQGL